MNKAEEKLFVQRIQNWMEFNRNLIDELKPHAGNPSVNNVILAKMGELEALEAIYEHMQGNEAALKIMGGR